MNEAARTTDPTPATLTRAWATVSGLRTHRVRTTARRNQVVGRDDLDTGSLTATSSGRRLSMLHAIFHSAQSVSRTGAPPGRFSAGPSQRYPLVARLPRSARRA